MEKGTKIRAHLYLQIKQSSHESIINFLSCRVSSFLCFFCYVCVDARRKKATHVYVPTNFFFVLSLFGKFPKHEISQENAMNTRQDKKQKNQNELDTIGPPRPVLPCAHMATLRFVFSLFLFLIIVKKETNRKTRHTLTQKERLNTLTGYSWHPLSVLLWLWLQQQTTIYYLYLTHRHSTLGSRPTLIKHSVPCATFINL